MKNRSAEAQDPGSGSQRVPQPGNVDKYGIDGSISYQPIPQISLYAFGPYMKPKIKDDLIVAELPNGTTITLLTAGKRESGAPVFTLGGRAQASLGPPDLGARRSSVPASAT